MITSQLVSRVKPALESIITVQEEAQGRALIPPQTQTVASATQALVAVGDEIRSAGDQVVTQCYDGLLESLADSQPATAARYADELSRRLDLLARHSRMSGEERNIRDAMGPLLASGGHRSVTSDIAPLWAEYRNQGFAALDVGLSPQFMQTRALGSSGGSAIATTFADRVVVFERTLSPMLDPNIVTFSNSTSGNPFRVPRLTADVSLGGTVTAEAGAITEADPTISHIELTPYKYPVITLWSAELEQDEIIEIESLIAKSNARELAIDIGAHLTTGDGSGKPQGFVGAATVGGTADKTFGGTATTFFDYGDLVDLWGSLAAPYRSVGVWQLSTDAFVKVQRFRDDNGNLALLPGLTGGPPTLLGRPVYENPAMASVGSASKSVAFGDFSAYWVRRVAPLRIELSRDYKFGTDQVALKVVERVDGDLIDTVAVKTLVSADT